MKRIILVCLLVAFLATPALAVKPVNFTTTEVVQVIVAFENNVATISARAVIYDGGGVEIMRVYKQYSFDDLPAAARNGLNNAMKHISKEINNEFAAENSETWTDK